MSDATGLVAHCTELLSVLGPVRVRRMFGGSGFYLDGLFMALIAGDTLFLKADATARPPFEAAGCRPFEYDTRQGTRTMPGYWSAPDEAMESPAAMRPWARLALASALRAAAAKRPVAARKTSARKTAAKPRKKAPAKA